MCRNWLPATLWNSALGNSTLGTLVVAAHSCPQPVTSQCSTIQYCPPAILYQLATGCCSQAPVTLICCSLGLYTTPFFVFSNGSLPNNTPHYQVTSNDFQQPVNLFCNSLLSARCTLLSAEDQHQWHQCLLSFDHFGNDKVSNAAFSQNRESATAEQWPGCQEGNGGTFGGTFG